MTGGSTGFHRCLAAERSERAEHESRDSQPHSMGHITGNGPRSTMRNLTPHTIVVGERSFPPSGTVARVTSVATEVAPEDGIPIVHTTYGAIEGLPPDGETDPVLVSSLVLSALAASGRKLSYRVLAPDTGPDSVIRDAAGKIVGVKRLMQ
ncbi:MAG: hypothetical protein KGL39_55205 [Patescibacteria group bacterium]|nr:hypothetical protein [Patescibacteria group bacterium]